MNRLLRCVLILSLAAMTARGDDWTHGGLHDGRTRLPGETVLSPALLGAPVAVGTGAVASPVAADGYLVVAGVDGRVRAYRESDLALLWTTAPGSLIIGTPMVYRGRVYVPSTDGTLRILRLETGALLGSVVTGGADRSSPVFKAGRVYLGSGFPNTSLLAIDPGTKTVAWEASLDQVTNSSPAFGEGKVMVATNNGTLYAFDESTGAPVWSTSVGGTTGAASPLVLGSSVFLLSGNKLSRVALDESNWSSNASVTLTDPQFAPANAIDQDVVGSSLALVGGYLVGILRFDYPKDDLPAGSADGYPDHWTLREYAFAVDPSSLAIVWQTFLGESTVPDQNGVPPHGVLPSPVGLSASVSAFASSLLPSITLLNPATGGSGGAALALDAPCLASPIVSNARLHAVTVNGTLYAFQGTHAQPAAAAGLSPSNLELTATPGTLTWNAVPSATSYEVRSGDDGDVLMDWDHEFVVNTNSVACPPLLDGYFHTWGVRVRDVTGAYSPWTLTTFAQNIPLLPPSGLVATGGHLSATLTWTASPSVLATGYRLSYGSTGGPVGTTLDLGLVTTITIAGLAAGTNLTFQLQTLNALGVLSAPVTATATPHALITINGTDYASIGAAAAAAHSGDTIQLGQDTYTIDSTILLPPGVSLRGMNAFATRLEASSSIVMIDAREGSEVGGLSLALGLVGVKATGVHVTVDHCVIHDMTDSGIWVTGSASVINNTLVRNTVAGLRSSGQADARNNIVQENGVGLSGVVASKYNAVSDGYAVCLPGAGDRSGPVAFLDGAAGDYREQAAQPSLDAGAPDDDYSKEPSLNGARINMGAFGNTSLAAASLTGGPPPSPSSGACGLTGLEVVLLLLVLRRRRR